MKHPFHSLCAIERALSVGLRLFGFCLVVLTCSRPNDEIPAKFRSIHDSQAWAQRDLFMGRVKMRVAPEFADVKPTVSDTEAEWRAQIPHRRFRLGISNSRNVNLGLSPAIPDLMHGKDSLMTWTESISGHTMEFKTWVVRRFVPGVHVATGRTRLQNGEWLTAIMISGDADGDRRLVDMVRSIQIN